jgi:hypothetical protein
MGALSGGYYPRLLPAAVDGLVVGIHQGVALADLLCSEQDGSPFFWPASSAIYSRPACFAELCRQRRLIDNGNFRPASSDKEQRVQSIGDDTLTLPRRKRNEEELHLRCSPSLHGLSPSPQFSLSNI